MIDFVSYVSGSIGTVIKLVWDGGKFVFLRLRHRSLFQIWSRFKTDDQKFHIVIPSITQESFEVRSEAIDRRAPSKLSYLPENVKMMSFAESVALAKLQRKIEQLFPKSEVVFHYSDTFSHHTESYISVGGPSVNKSTHSLLVDRKIDAGLSLVYPDHFAKDSARETELRARVCDDVLLEDIGFCLFAANPLAPTKVVMVLCGIWSNGTEAAIQAITTERESRRKIAEAIQVAPRKVIWDGIRGHQRNLKQILVVTRAQVEGVTTGSPEIVYIRELVGPDELSVASSGSHRPMPSEEVEHA